MNNRLRVIKNVIDNEMPGFNGFGQLNESLDEFDKNTFAFMLAGRIEKAVSQADDDKPSTDAVQEDDSGPYFRWDEERNELRVWTGRPQWAGISGRSSGYGKYRKELVESGLVVIDDNMFTAHGTVSGAAFAPQTLDEWLRRLPPSFRSMLRVIAEMDGEYLDRGTIAERANVSPTSSGLYSGLRELLELGLIDKDGDGLFALHPDLHGSGGA